LLCAAPDGSRLIIDGEIVVENDGVHYYLEQAGDVVALTSGRHTFELQYFHKEGKLFEGVRGARSLECSFSLQGLGWRNTGGFAKRALPTELLYTSTPHEEVTAAAVEAAATHLKLEQANRLLQEQLSAANGKLEKMERAFRELRSGHEAEIRASKLTVANATRDQHVACAEVHELGAQLLLKDGALGELSELCFFHVCLTVKLQLHGENNHVRITLNASEIYDIVRDKHVAPSQWPSEVRALLTGAQ
jgi:hypothetical protein